MNYYNERDKDAAAWLREAIRAGLIPTGDVDERSITEVKAHELTNYTQCHFFAGIGGWPLAFQLSGVRDDENADTGSCPCQPFSGTGKQMGFTDPRHLWPSFRRIENRRRPAKIYGEQVASKLGREWLSRVFSDLEIMGYAGSGADLCSAGVGAPNIRQRLYWVGERVGMEYATRNGWEQRRPGPDGWSTPGGCGAGGMAKSDNDDTTRGIAVETRKSDGTAQARAQSQSGRCGVSGGLGHTLRAGSFSASQPGEDCSETGRGTRDGMPSGSSPTPRLGHADHARQQGRIVRWDGPDQRPAWKTGLGVWSDCELVWCRDEKWRRIEPGSFPLADGIPSRVGPLLTELRKLGKRSISLARANRNIRLKGYGNAINPFVAAKFIQADRMGGLSVAQPHWHD